MIAPWVVGAPVRAYGDCLGTILAVRRDPHPYMGGVWLRVRWSDGFGSWVPAADCDALDASFS